MRIASAAWVCLLILPTVMASAQSPQPASRSARPSVAEPKSERKNETRNVAKSQSKSDAKTKAAAPPGHDPNAGLAPADRVRLELDLAWAGFYTGLISGESDDKATAAVKAFQKDFKFKETGTLAPSERTLVGNLATQKQEQAGWRMVEDAVTGAELGLPTKYVPNSGRAAAARAGSRHRARSRSRRSESAGPAPRSRTCWRSRRSREGAKSRRACCGRIPSSCPACRD